MERAEIPTKSSHPTVRSGEVAIEGISPSTAGHRSEPGNAAVEAGERTWINVLLDSIFVLRPTLVFPLMTMLLVGHAFNPAPVPVAPLDWALLVAGLCCMFGLGYLLNQLRDRDSDAANGKLFLVSGGHLSRRHLNIEAAVLSVASPVLLILAGFGNLALWALLMFILGGILYNFTPLALESKPWGGVLAGFLGAWLLMGMGMAVAGGRLDILRALPYALAFTSACLLTGLLDVQGDRLSGKRTFAVAYGVRGTMLAATVGLLAVLALGVSGKSLDWLIVIPAAAALPLFVLGWWKQRIELAVTANKLAIFLLSLGVGIRYPVYLAAMVVYFILARVYYRRRFGIGYPSFAGR